MCIEVRNKIAHFPLYFIPYTANSLVNILHILKFKHCIALHFRIYIFYTFYLYLLLTFTELVFLSLTLFILTVVHHDKFLTYLLGNKPISESDSEKLKCYQSGQMGFLFNWLLLFLFLLQLFAN